MTSSSERDVHDDVHHQLEKRQSDEGSNVGNTLAVEGSTQWWSDEEDRRVRRKLDLNIVPWLFVTYLLAFLDRGNIGNANTAGLSKSLRLSDAQYQWLLTIFYISYITCQSLLIGYKLLPPSKFMGICVTVWGIAAILQGAAFNWSGMMAARFFIGMAEAGYGTGVALYLSFFYPRDEIGTRFAGFVVGSAVASAIAGSVAYGLQMAKTSTDAWRLIFIVEAAPTLILGVLIFFFLPDSIATARFLTPYQRQVAEARLYRAAIDRRQSESGAAKGMSLLAIGNHIREALHWRNGAEAFKDPISYMSASLLFIINVGFASVPVYLPTILTGMGYTHLRAQAFSAPPYAAAFVTAVAFAYAGDRFRIRGLFLALTVSIAFSGYFILATVSDNHARYGAVWLVVLGLFTSVPLCYMWLIANSSGETKRGFALIMFGTVGQCGPVLGTRLFPAADAPYYRHGMFINAGLLVGALLIIVGGLIYIFFQNRRKDSELAAIRQASLREADDSSDEKTEGKTADEFNSANIRFQRHLDPKILAKRDEIHRRKVDIALHRERSVYFRYCF